MSPISDDVALNSVSKTSVIGAMDARKKKVNAYSHPVNTTVI